MAQKKSSQGSRGPAAKKGASRAPAKKAGTRPVAKKKVREPEPTPVVGGRFIIAAIIVALMVFIPMSTIGNWFQKPTARTDTSKWRKGNTAEVQITLVTSDYHNLHCASDKAIDGAHCGYKSPDEGFPNAPGAPLDDNKKNIIQPYRTWPDNQLILVAGLWATPAVAMRLHDEPPTSVADKKLARFITTCKVRFLGQLKNSKLHWQPNGKWLDQPFAEVARALSCKINKED